MKKSIFVLIITVTFATSTIFAVDTLPEFTLEDINGDQISSEELLNKKAVIIDFWANGCVPCRKALTYFSNFQEEYNDLVNVVCINTDKARDANKVRSFVKSKNFAFITLLDQNKKVRELFNINTIPRTFIINDSNEIVYKHEGYTQGDEHEIEAALRKVMFKDITIEQLNELYPPEELPKPTVYIDPLYPTEAYEAKIEADIILDLEILEDGTVGDLCVVSTNADKEYIFEDAAIYAAQQWIFEPVMAKEEPTKVRILYPIRFRI